MSLFLATGQRSNDIAALQNALNAALQTRLVLDGMFGPKTGAALRRFQSLHGLTPDGIAGPRTLPHLFEGVEVDSSVTVEPAGRKLPAGRFGLDGGPRQPRPEIDGPSPLSFGSIGLLNRDFQVRRWAADVCPKPTPIQAPRLTAPPPVDMLAMHRFGIPVQRLSLPPAAPAVSRPFTGKGFSFDLELSASTSDFKALDWTFKFKSIQPKSHGFFKPSVSLKASPDGTWTATTKVSVQPFKILDEEWKRFSFEVKPLITASLTTPFILGEDPSEPYPKLKASLGGKAELAWRPIDRQRNFELFFGGGVGVSGFLKFDGGSLKGGGVTPDVELNGGVRFSFGK